MRIAGRSCRLHTHKKMKMKEYGNINSKIDRQNNGLNVNCVFVFQHRLKNRNAYTHTSMLKRVGMVTAFAGWK